MRFRPEQHLRRQSDFRAVREQGRRLNCGAFAMGFLQRDTVGAATLPRLGVVASTASVGHAVLRNRAKRRLREVFRNNQQFIPAGCDILLTARAAAVSLPMPELEKRFVEACRQIRGPKTDTA